jgi:hypothetical protein
MTERVPHDADGVPTYDGVVTRQGRTGRYTVRFPTEANLPLETVVRIVLDGSEYRTQAVQPFREDGIEIRGVFDSARETREPQVGDRHLTRWIEAKGVEPGRTVHLDIVVPDYRYGLRVPGQEAVYHPSEPDSSLRNIAEDL